MRLVAVGLYCDWYNHYGACVCLLSRFSCVQLFATLWTVACQSSLSIGFSRYEYWSGLPCLPPGDLPDPGTEPSSLVSAALTGGFFTTSATWEAQYFCYLSSQFIIKYLLVSLFVVWLSYEIHKSRDTSGWFCSFFPVPSTELALSISQSSK